MFEAKESIGKYGFWSKMDYSDEILLIYFEILSFD